MVIEWNVRSLGLDMSTTIALAVTDEPDRERQELRETRDALRRACRPLSGAEEEPAFAELERVAAWCRDREIRADTYGEGPDLQAFEARVADLLGFEAARFMPSGTMAQQIVARIWSGRTGRQVIGMHPTCHLELHEEQGYSRLHGLAAQLVGPAERPMTAADLATAPEPMAAVIVELPTRENGGQLPTWEDLVELCQAARDRGIATHLDGARFWEAAAGYERPLDEIAALFDSAYVSFYKGIGALPGSMLAGPADVIDEAKIWQRRSGGNLHTLTANWASAAMRLDDRLRNMPAYRDRARELAAALSPVEGVTVNPDPPQVNMFHVFLAGDCDALLAARDQIAREHELWLFGSLMTTDVPGIHRFELTVGDAALAVDVSKVAVAFDELLRLVAADPMVDTG